jgi:NADH-quinone oxidoreductase subunit A
VKGVVVKSAVPLPLEDNPVNEILWPLVLYFLVVLVLLAAILGISVLLGETHKERTTGEPYESGMRLTGSAHTHISVNFYLIAVFFVIFDLEALFVFAWAVGLRESGWAGYLEMLVFVIVLIAGLVYLWKVRALDLQGAGRRLETGTGPQGCR